LIPRPARLDVRLLAEVPFVGGAVAANRRIAASSVALIQPGMNAPCVLALLGSQPPRTSQRAESII